MKNKPAADLPDQKLAANWADLAGDARQAYPAQWQLALAGNGVAYLDKMLPTPVKLDPQQVDAWIKDLDSTNFNIRQTAQAKLEEFVGQAEPALRAALKNALSADVHLRVAKILKLVDEPGGKYLQKLRALEVLEWAATPAARQVVARLARGPDGRLTRAAQATLARMKS
jgi:hypothetical protein